MPETSSSIFVRTAGLLLLSNVFMTFAWYAHLRNLAHRPWYLAALVSWGIALFEYLLQVPANRIGYTAMTLRQLKVLQEVITLVVFVPFAVLYMRQPSSSTTCGPLSAWSGRSTSSSARPRLMMRVPVYLAAGMLLPDSPASAQAQTARPARDDWASRSRAPRDRSMPSPTFPAWRWATPPDRAGLGQAAGWSRAGADRSDGGLSAAARVTCRRCSPAGSASTATAR